MSGINELIARLERLGSEATQRAIAEKQREAAHDVCLKGFADERDPYGVPWAKRKPPTGTWKLLDKTGAGVESLTSLVSNGSVQLRIKGFFKYHQTGTSRMVDRKIFPSPSYGLGNWKAPLDDAALDAVRDLMRK